MKALIQQTLELMGAEVRQLPDDELQVRAPDKSPASRLLKGSSVHHLSFSPQNTNPAATIVAPGSALLEAAAKDLGTAGSVRHGALPRRFEISKKDLKSKYRFFAGRCERFACKRGWQTTVRLWVKAVLSGDAVVEILEGVEISPNGQIRRIESTTPPGQGICWIEKPPLKRYQLIELIETGMAFADNLIIDRTDLQSQKLKRLYATLDKLRIYYHQLKEETVGDGKEDAVAAVEAEYQRRKQEELEYARVRASTKLIAVETISIPVQELRWDMERSGNRHRIAAAFNLFSGELAATTHCSICKKPKWTIGLSCTGVLVCPDCYAQCDFCDDEIAEEQAATTRMCSICGKKVCRQHGALCGTCGRLVCRDHQAHCTQGCCTCHECVRTCSQCGKEVKWCKNHTIINIAGDVVCRNHAVYCIGCRDYYPMHKTEACDACGQTVCFSCQEICRSCAGTFCLNHITNGECRKCRTSNNQMNLF